MVSGPSQAWAMVLYNVSGPGVDLLGCQRRILGEVAHTDGTSHSHNYVVLTPDGDVYLEDYSGRDRWITVVRLSATRRALPSGVPAASTYRFTDETPADELATARTLAKEAAEDWWSSHGGPAPPTNCLLPVGETPPPVGVATGVLSGSAANPVPAGDTMDARIRPSIYVPMGVGPSSHGGMSPRGFLKPAAPTGRLMDLAPSPGLSLIHI